MEKFRRAKVFHCISCSSFAVQVAASDEAALLPGIIQVHCSDVDWGYLGRCPVLLERRLCKLGTPASVFTDKCGTILCHEGVTIQLGSYDAKLKGFVHCRLKVRDNNASGEATRRNEICIVQGSQVNKRKREDREEVPDPRGELHNTHIHMHKHTYTHTHIHICTYTHTRTHTHIHMHIYIHIHTHQCL
jgi:hypothetical protein